MTPLERALIEKQDKLASREPRQKELAEKETKQRRERFREAAKRDEELLTWLMKKGEW